MAFLIRSLQVTNSHVDLRRSEEEGDCRDVAGYCFCRLCKRFQEMHGGYNLNVDSKRCMEDIIWMLIQYIKLFTCSQTNSSCKLKDARNHDSLPKLECPTSHRCSKCICLLQCRPQVNIDWDSKSCHVIDDGLTTSLAPMPHAMKKAASPAHATIHR